MSFEKLVKGMMSLSLVAITSMLVVAGIKGEAVEVIGDDYDPTVTAADLEDVAVTEYCLPEYKTYESKEGWTVQYNTEVFQVEEGNDFVGFDYTGDCSGRCMVTVSTLTGMTQEEARDEMVNMWGEKATTYEGHFSVDEKFAYWVCMESEVGEGLGLYDTAIIVEHNGNTILFECVEYMGIDEEVDMMVSDELAMIIDSVQFN
ncbi:hypothetical protein [Pseudobutyrivibrio xylanivorans]|uniref:Uncharacterized protein n=1 Tax=Pseudobutyrivibrio xylanivorans DSM 14809 TaxID=1123012 RepID=A0A1M6FCE0_PSEXY|nr:hypothetical protein [Pseudobutyrivibrio xylanivorans]SHI95335.1 hypothetical protein SAMN02745725_01457 [Pseudobutyrivibrio xylanivorans DSM 14809]